MGRSSFQVAYIFPDDRENIPDRPKRGALSATKRAGIFPGSFNRCYSVVRSSECQNNANVSGGLTSLRRNDVPFFRPICDCIKIEKNQTHRLPQKTFLEGQRLRVRMLRVDPLAEPSAGLTAERFKLFKMGFLRMCAADSDEQTLNTVHRNHPFVFFWSFLFCLILFYGFIIAGKLDKVNSFFIKN